MSCVNIVDNDSTGFSDSFADNWGCVTHISGRETTVKDKITFYPNGTWSIARTPAMVGDARNGLWMLTPPANPSLYEIRITGTVVVTTTTDHGFPGEPPPSTDTDVTSYPVDTGYLSLGVPQGVELTSYALAHLAAPNQGQIAAFDFTVEIRRIANPADNVTASGSFCSSAQAEYYSGGDPSP